MTNSKNVPVFRSAYTPHERQQLLFPNPSRTKQSDKDSCDINILMKRYEKDGLVSHLNEHQGQYGDFLGIPDYQDALNQISAAQDAFASLPASVRKKFDNDPAQFIDFAQNPDNLDAMVEMGLGNRPVPPRQAPSQEEYADADTSTPPSHEDNLKGPPLPLEGGSSAVTKGSK